MAPVAQPKLSRKHGAAVPLDELDKKLLNLMQGRFPIEPRPYLRVAELAEMSEDEVMSRVQHLLDERIIRQVTPIFDTRALGYASMLVAREGRPREPASRGQGDQRAPGCLAQLPAQPRLQHLVHDRDGAGLEARARGHARHPRAPSGRRVGAPAAHAQDVQDPHGPGDGGRHRRALDPGRGRGARRDGGPSPTTTSTRP